MKNTIRRFCMSLQDFLPDNFIFCVIAISLFAYTSNAQTFPAGFSQVTVGTIYYPTSMAFAPDGRIFTTEKSGKVKIIKNGIVLSIPFLTLSVDQLNERGLSSVAIDPDFSNNHYVYVYYTTSSSPIHNRLSRFTANGDVAVSGSEVQIINFETCENSIHNGGGMEFGADGKLYIAIGNDNVNSYSQNIHNYKGKLLRINKDGSVPSGNPFSGSASASRIWALGLRNPWSIAIQPGTGKIFVNDVGEGAWEEINNATTAGKNFGWPGAEGMSSNPAYTNPVYAYPNGYTGTNNGCAITGGSFFNPSSTNYPAAYTGKFFFIDYCNQWINYLDLTSGATKYNFATALPSACNYLKVGTDGNLYYFSISQNKLYKIIYSNTSAPSITNNPSNTTVAAGQQAAFSVSASGATPLSYQWQKNSVNISGANNSTYTINNTQQSHAGSYRAIVSNSFGNATSSPATLTVTTFNANPVATIVTPSSGTFYHSGDIITFSGTGTDQEDGNLSANAYHWFVEFRHINHIHPGPFIQAGITQGSFSTTFGETSANVYFRLFLVITDSGNLTDTAYVDIHPVTSSLSLLTQPSGLQVILDGQPHQAPYSVLAVSGMTRSLGLVTPQTLNGNSYVFDHWSNGGSINQNILIGNSNQTFTAYFNNNGPSSCSASGTILREFWPNITTYSFTGAPFNSPASSTSQLSLFEGPSNVADNYASRIRGYICPPATGNYTFWIASDNSSELWLSTNDMPANKVKIAFVPSWTGYRQWTSMASQQSAPISLMANVKYYIEAIHRDGSQGDNLSVGWKLPNGTLERPIPGNRLSPFVISGSGSPTVSISSPTTGSVFSTPANITIEATANSGSGSIAKVQFYQGGAFLGEDLTAPFLFTWMNVTTGNYSLTAIAIDNLNQSTVSQVVPISVASCATPVITAMGPTTFCDGSVLLQVNAVQGNIYQWKKDGADISGATNSSFTATSSGDYQIKVIQGSCISWSAPMRVSKENTLSARITPGGPTTFCSGGNVILYGNTCSGFTYQWIKNGVNISGATASNYTVTTSGGYQLKTSMGASNAWSSILAVTINSCREARTEEPVEIETISVIPESNNTFQMKVYPNPNNGLFSFTFNMPVSNERNVKIQIINALSQVVYSKEFVEETDFLKASIELDQSLPTGFYNIQMLIGTKTENTSMVLIR